MCMAVSKKDLQCTIGKNIRDARKTCGYTKEVLAEKAEISVEHITQVERGDKMMSVPSLVRMAEALHVSVDADIRTCCERCKAEHCAASCICK